MLPLPPAFLKRTARVYESTNYLAAAAFFLFVLVGLTACERAVTDSEKTAVLAFSEVTTDNLLVGLSTNDYAQFIRNFDSELLGRVPIAEFTTLQQELDNKLGSYLSRRVEQVTKADEFYVVVYQASFEQAKVVTMTVAFHDSDQAIATLGIDSEYMSWSAFQKR